MFAAIEPFNGLGGLLDATQNVLRVPNLALPHPFGKGTDRFREPWRVIGRQKPAHASPLDNEVPFRTKLSVKIDTRLVLICPPPSL